MKDATELQMEVLRFCKEQESKNGRFPTHREIGKRFSWASTVSARAHLIALEKKGLVEKIGRYYRVKSQVDHEALLRAILKADGIAEIVKAINAAKAAIG